MSSPTHRPTLLDVARLAGVSRATASRVLAGSDTVSSQLAQKVTAAASQLDYRTNTAARALRRGTAGSIAVVVPTSELGGLYGPFVGAPLQGAAAVLFAHSLQPVLLLQDGRDSAPLLRHLSSGHVDAAVVILQRETDLIFRDLDDVTVPVIYVGHPRADLDPGRSYVDSDNYGGARLATRALLEAGRRRIATIAGPADYRPSEERLRGFLDEHAAWSADPGPVARGNFSVPTGSLAATQLLRRSPTLDGLFAASDLMAVGAMRVLEASGRQVPDDVSIVAFDDTVVAATANPPLTSVNQPFQAMGAKAAELALQALGAPFEEPRHVVLPTTLTRRESV